MLLGKYEKLSSLDNTHYLFLSGVKLKLFISKKWSWSVCSFLHADHHLLVPVLSLPSMVLRSHIFLTLMRMHRCARRPGYLEVAYVTRYLFFWSSLGYSWYGSHYAKTVLITYIFNFNHAPTTTGPRSLALHLRHCMCVNSEGSGETTQLQRLTWTFTVPI